MKKALPKDRFHEDNGEEIASNLDRFLHDAEDYLREAAWADNHSSDVEPMMEDWEL